MLIKKIGIQFASNSMESGSGRRSCLNMTDCHCELQVTEITIYFVFSEIRENQIPGDCTEELCRDLCMGPQAVP